MANLEERITQIACGKRHSAAITENGQLYTWGSNEYGQLGRQAARGIKLQLKKHGSTTQSTLGSQIVTSAKSSPSMNPIQTTYNFSRQHKIPLSTDNQAMHRFEFPISNGTSGDSADDFDSHFRVSLAPF